MARIYIEENFLPWVFYKESYSFLRCVSLEKEKYFVDTYNHISTECKEQQIYYLYDFCCVFEKMLIANKEFEVISVKLPAKKEPTTYSYIYYLLSGEEKYYFLVDFFSNIYIIKNIKQIIKARSLNYLLSIKEFIEKGDVDV